MGKGRKHWGNTKKIGGTLNWKILAYLVLGKGLLPRFIIQGLVPSL